MRRLWVALITLIALQVAYAHASTVDFDVTATCPTCPLTVASFVLVTTDEGGGKYLITSALGTIGGSPITVLAPDSLGNDNLLFFPPTAGPTDNYFDSQGWAYTLTSIPSGVNAACTSSTLCTNTVGALKADFTLDSVTPIPLPAALPLFATGLGAIGLLGWRRKRRATQWGASGWPSNV